jgi:hypothetical protein
MLAAERAAQALRAGSAASRPSSSVPPRCDCPDEAILHRTMRHPVRGTERVKRPTFDGSDEIPQVTARIADVDETRARGVGQSTLTTSRIRNIADLHNSWGSAAVATCASVARNFPSPALICVHQRASAVPIPCRLAYHSDRPSVAPQPSHGARSRTVVPPGSSVKFEPQLHADRPRRCANPRGSCAPRQKRLLTRPIERWHHSPTD